MSEELFIERVLNDVMELPDRTSPEDQPMMCLVTGEELAGIIRSHLPDAITRLTQERDAARAEALEEAAKVAGKAGREFIADRDAYVMHGPAGIAHFP